MSHLTALGKHSSASKEVIFPEVPLHTCAPGLLVLCLLKLEGTFEGLKETIRSLVTASDYK